MESVMQIVSTYNLQLLECVETGQYERFLCNTTFVEMISQRSLVLVVL